MADQKQNWLQIVVTQYSTFGTIAGLEVASLAIFSSSDISLSGKIIFSVTSFFLLVQIVLLLWLINQEREAAFNPNKITSFMLNESVYRNILMFVMVITWGLILSLLLLRIWL